jgi:Tol biopolymer transport system component
MPSDSDARVDARSGPTDDAVRGQLDRILASPVFSRSPQLRRLLSFVVAQTLAGQGHTLKEAVLAHELYGKGNDFDAGTDPVVRVDARRLRDKLREFYEGRSEPIVISLPKGSYVPVFGGNAAAVPDAATPETLEAAPEARLVSKDFARAKVSLAAVAVLGIIATTVIVWRTLPTSADAPMQLLPLASYPGTEGAPALSPSGDLVAFAWTGHDGPGPTDIYVKAVESEALRRLTDTPTAETAPAWSPDGHSIAFVRVGQGVFTMSQLGGAERQVSASGTHVAWAGDSRSVLIRDRDGNGPHGIHQVFLDTLERRRLTQAPVGDGDWRFEVSPDGRSLAFIRYQRRGIADLYVVPMAGGQPRRLTDWNAVLMGLSWTADGREIVYSVENSPAARLWRIDANITRPGRGSPVADIPIAAESPSISRPPPGEPGRLAFQTITRDVDLQMMDLRERLVNVTMTSTPFAKSTRIEGSAAFSPDGSRIAFVSFRAGGADLWTAERDGSGLRQLTALGANQLIVGGWSPDGARIAFDAVIAGNSDVYVIDANGGHLRRLTSAPSLEGTPSWSSDGRWIYFSSTRGGVSPDVWRMSSAGEDPIRLTTGGGFEPKESLDGQHVFFLDRHPAALGSGATARLMRQPAAGGQAEPLVEGLRPFLWSVTEQGVVFLHREPDFDALDVYGFSDRRVTRAGRLAFRVSPSFTWMTTSRDGRWALATNMVRHDADLMMLVNFR